MRGGSKPRISFTKPSTLARVVGSRAGIGSTPATGSTAIGADDALSLREYPASTSGYSTWSN